MEEERILIYEIKESKKVEDGAEIEIFMMSYVIEGLRNVFSVCL